MKELRNKSTEELVNILKDSQKERMNLRFMKASKEGFDVNRGRFVKRQIARVKTILNEKNLRGENA